jgi:hypothetical protein
MVRLSRERIVQLSRDLLDALVRDNTVVLLKDRDAVRQAIAAALAEEFKREEEREQLVRRRIATTPGAPSDGSREYDALYRKLLEEEYVRESLDS